MTIQLRPYQSQLKSDVYGAWGRGNRHALAVLPTGGGKSVVVSDIALDFDQQNSTQAVIAHRTELVGQMSMHIANRGIRHRIIAPKKTLTAIINEHRRNFNGRSFIAPDARASVVAVDTLIARKAALQSWAQQIDAWTIDEAHHVLRANKWGHAVELFPNAYGLGVTASPCRADGAGLGSHADGVFDEMVIGPTMRELINLSQLCDYEIVCPESDLIVDDDDFSASGELSPAKGRVASKRSHIVGDVVLEYIKHAMGKRCIVFATDVETSKEIADNFNAHGIAAAAVSANTPDEIRAEYIRRFRDGRLTVLVNVDLFGEGFDVPAVEVVVMARPTGSLAVYLQQFGRALRLLAGKLFGLIIDMVSNVKRHGLPDKPHAWTLDRREKRAKKEKHPEEVELTVCRGTRENPGCSRPYEKVLTCCPYCGMVPPLPEPGLRTLEVVDGDLVYLDASRLAEMRAAATLESPAAVANRVAYVAGGAAGGAAVNKQMARIEAQERLKATIAQWAGIERFKGRDDRESHKRFYLTAGMSVLEALALDLQGMETMIERIEGWYR